MRHVRLAAAVFSLATPVFAQNLEIHYINVGWGSSVFVRGPNGTTVLMEAGNTGKGNSEVVPYLQSIGHPPSAGFDYTVAGHQHCDHVGGMDEVIGAGYNVRVRNYDNGSNYSSSCITQWNAAAGGTTAGAPVRAQPGDEIPLGNGARLIVLASLGDVIGGASVQASNENDLSVAVLIKYGGFDYLWASDMGGGNVDSSCTGRSTTQVDVETSVVQAISPGGASPLISAGGIDVINVNHHGSESSTNRNWMNLSRPAVAVIPTGAGQSADWHLPRIDVVDKVLRATATACVTVPGAFVVQTEEGSPIGSQTSRTGYSVGNVRITTNGASTFTLSADGQVNQGPNEVALAGLPRSFALDDTAAPPPTTLDISGWRLVQANSARTYTLPTGTRIPSGGYVVIGRNATKAAFESFWRGGTPLPSNAVYINSGDTAIVINGSENFALRNAAGTLIDGTTISQSSAGGQSIQRRDPCLAANLTSSWNVLASTSGGPGAGAGAGCARGVVINEFADALGSGNFAYEFVELHYDR